MGKVYFKYSICDMIVGASVSGIGGVGGGRCVVSDMLCVLRDPVWVSDLFLFGFCLQCKCG